MAQTNFLIGRGELLTSEISGPRRFNDKAPVYTFEEAKARLFPQLRSLVKTLDEIPKSACPKDYAVVCMALNPSYIAKSYYPGSILRAADLVSVGSRSVLIKPGKWSKKKPREICSTTEIFVAGTRDAFHGIIDIVKSAEEGSSVALDFSRFERISDFAPEMRVRNAVGRKDFFEVCVHLLPEEDPGFLVSSLESYAVSLGFITYHDLSFQAGNLWFLPVRGSREKIYDLARFAFVRVVRPVPKLRGLRPTKRSGGAGLKCVLPSEEPLSSLPKVAILDGGLPRENCIEKWVGSYKMLDPSAKSISEYSEHGLAVTSAFLFGPVVPGSVAQRPFSYVDHLRVIDAKADAEDPLELYRTLGLIEQVLLSRQYEFVNLSLGPDLPIEDSDVHAWTSVIDDLLSDGDTFMTIAVGNNGDADFASGNARIQVPSDCVNAVAVGAASAIGQNWGRASYSAFGPGRSPGVIKPDLVAFGGAVDKYFHVLSTGSAPALVPQIGTSFAAPYLLRCAVGIRAILGSDLSPLAIKALLVHTAVDSNYDKQEVGWGKVEENIMKVITCENGIARIVYQGELKPGKYLRAKIPLPTGGLTGRIQLKATFCYATPVDPQDASSYTKAGLDVVFRPNSKKIKEGKANSDTKSFFEMKKFATEKELRSDVGKWETVLHQQKGMLGTSLHEPVFDIHYNAREGGGGAQRAAKIKYALVVTVDAPKHLMLFNDILQNYSRILAPIQPVISLPVRV